MALPKNYFPEVYLAYLRSPQWAKKKTTFWKHTPYSCQGCHAKRNLQVHHHTYDRLGRERMSDLVALCYACHKKVHTLHRRNRFHGMTLTAATLRITEQKSVAPKKPRSVPPRTIKRTSAGLTRSKG